MGRGGSVIRKAVALGVLLLARAVGLGADQGPDAFRARLDAELPGLLETYGVPGLAVAKIVDGALAWEGAWGEAAAGRPLPAGALFEHGSNGKAIAAMAALRLVELGRIGLDEAVGPYLKRHRILAGEFSAEGVTLRRLLAHSAGFPIHGYLDYSPRRVRLPGLVETLEGAHLFEGLNEALLGHELSSGRARLVAEPGTAYRYSGAGYALVQLLVEDLTGMAFADFVAREIAEPLGLGGLVWDWSPELEARAAVPHGSEGQALEFRRLPVQAIGSEIMSAGDYARFLAALIPGPQGEAPGRGLIAPGLVAEMLRDQSPGGSGGYGLGLGMATNYGARAVWHSGATTGWTAYAFLDLERRIGFVSVSNSSRAAPLHRVVLGLWSDAEFGPAPRARPEPLPRLDPFAALYWSLAGLALISALHAGLGLWFGLLRGRRRASPRLKAGPALLGAAWLLAAAWTWYALHSSLPLHAPAWLPDLWPSSGSVAFIAAGLLAGALWLVRSFFPRAGSGR